jgi:hypothetical protein
MLVMFCDAQVFNAPIGLKAQAMEKMQAFTGGKK